ncbi:MAG: PQQ-binding-like beta-propeller repeat protein [Dehalococcoidales bacterium]|nr:PQQ-binding-like beta-propeller repeat protein [Dehalococcoidales bacterium]
MVKFVGEDGWYPDWARGEGRWVSQKVLHVRAHGGYLFEMTLTDWYKNRLVWVPPRPGFLGRRRISVQEEASRARAEASRLLLWCPTCGWRGQGREAGVSGYAPVWKPKCPECAEDLLPDLCQLDREAIVEMWETRGKPALEPPHASMELASVMPISDLRQRLSFREWSGEELAYVGQQLWPDLASFLQDTSSRLRRTDVFGSWLTAAQDVLCFATWGNTVASFSGQTGRPVWISELDSVSIYAPAVARNCLFAAADDGSLLALDAFSGKQLWRVSEHDCLMSTPAVQNGVLYVGTHAGSLLAIDAHSGGLRWEQPVGGRVFSTPAFECDRVLIVTDSGCCLGLDPTDGRMLWRHAIPNPEESSWDCHIVEDGIVYVPYAGREIVVLQADTGEHIGTWRLSEKDPDFVDLSLAVSGGLLVVAGGSGLVSALDKGDGNGRWIRGTSPSDPRFDGQVLVGGDLVYTRGETVFALALGSGNTLWRYDGDSLDYPESFALSGRVLCWTSGRDLVALDALTGEFRWRYEAEGSIEHCVTAVLASPVRLP